jgi:1,4-alpha-glucan branching enzyme
VYREWAPKAQDLYLFGDFNNWQRYSHRMTRNQFGVWEIFLDKETYKDHFTHESKIKVMVHSDLGFQERIPAYIRRVVQDPVTKDFTGQVWLPPTKFDWVNCSSMSVMLEWHRKQRRWADLLSLQTP